MPIKGYIEYVDATQVRGWAWDAEASDRPVTIQVRLGDQFIAEAPASIFREDLKASGIGSGQHGFVVEIAGRVAEERLIKQLNFLAYSDADKSVQLHKTVDADATKSRVTAASQKRSVEINFLDQRPIFILGAARSGTTAIAMALMHGAQISGHGESHVLGLLPSLHRALHEYYVANGEELGRKTTIARVPPMYFREQINVMFRSLMSTVYPTERWIDKTPSVTMIQAIPYLLTVWPNAQFIFMKRSGVDNILSRQRKFSDVSFESHCRDWATVMQEWRNFSAYCGANALEVDQWDLSRDVLNIAGSISRFLNLSEEDASGFARALASEHPEQTADTWNRRQTLSETNWTAEQKELFIAICAESMKDYGYDALG